MLDSTNRVLLTICPSRNRPNSCREMIESFVATRDDSQESALFVLVDTDDPLIEGYRALRGEYHDVVITEYPPRGSATIIADEEARFWADKPDIALIGFVGDDCRFRTPSWDEKFLRYTRGKEPCIIYPADGFRTDNLPTHSWLSSSIVRTVGLCPHFYHLGIDVVWHLWGRTLGPEHFLHAPEVLVEHLHPLAGKAEMDSSYERTSGAAALRTTELELWRYKRDFELPGGDRDKLLSLLKKGTTSEPGPVNHQA